MLTINTNLSSLVAQSSLKTSTNKLNQAIERMTTGFKINHASDNAANFGIVTGINTRMGSLAVAEDNALMSLDFVNGISSCIDLVTDHLTRIRDLATMSANGAISIAARKILQKEVESRLEETKRIVEKDDYFIVKDPVQTFSNNSDTIETEADANTTLDELGITEFELKINDKTHSVINSYTLNGLDSIGKILNILQGNGLRADINSGIISVSSADGSYVSGSLADALGISVVTETIVTNATSSSANKLYVSTTVYADETTSFAQAGLQVAGKSIEVRTKKGNSLVGVVTVNSDTQSFSDLFDLLKVYGVRGSISNGKIVLDSQDNYVTGDLANVLGFQTITDSTTTTVGQSTTSTLPIKYTVTTTALLGTTLGELGINNTSLIVESTNGVVLNNISVTSTTSIEGLFNVLNANTITAALTNGVITLSGPNVITGDLAASLGITKNTVTQIVNMTTGMEVTSGEIVVTLNVSVTETTSIKAPSATFLKPVSRVYPTNAIRIEDSNVNFLSAGFTYTINTTEGLLKLAELVNNGKVSDPSDKTEFPEVILMNDINLSSVSSWTPIGNSKDCRINFNGNGYTIQHMTIVEDKDYSIGTYEDIYLGLFGKMQGCISNLQLANSRIIFTDTTSINPDLYDKDNQPYICGAIAGMAAQIDNCVAVSISIEARSSVDNLKNKNENIIGGLVGISTQVDYSSFFGNIKLYEGFDGYCGGLVGLYAETPPIAPIWTSLSNSYATGNITCSRYDDKAIVGGFIGYSIGANIYDNTSTVRGAKNGFIGKYLPSDGLSIKNNNVCLPSTTGAAPVGNAVDGLLEFNGSIFITPFNELGVTSNAQMTIVNQGVSTIITVKPSDTLYSLSAVLQQHGINMNYDSFTRKIVVSESNAYIKEMSSELQNALKISIGEGKSYESTPVAGQLVSTNSSSKILGTLSTLTVDESKTLGVLGVTSPQQVVVKRNGVKSTVTILSTDTIADLTSKLAQYGISALLQKGKLTFDGNSSVYIESFTTQLADALNIQAGENYTYTVNSEFIYSNSSSNITYSSTKTELLSSNTSVNDIKGYSNGSGKLHLYKNGVCYTINISQTDTLQKLFDKIQSYGITGSIMDGKMILSANGDVYLQEAAGGSNLLTVLGMSPVQKTQGVKTENTSSKKLLYKKNLDNWTNYSLDMDFGVVAGNPNDKISLKLDFGINYAFDVSTKDSARKAIIELDHMIKYLNASQSTLGSIQNRFMSVLEEISIKYDNLVSSRSTLRDADIAELSSTYIQQQILQQASATLLATANQSPSIALQLL